MKKRQIIFLLSLVVLTSSCATILTGTRDDIYFSVQPEKAKIYINGVSEAVGSSEISVRRSYKKKTVTIKCDGYEDNTFVLEKRFNVVALLDIILWWGIFVDAPMATIVKYDKKYYDIELEKVKVK